MSEGSASGAAAARRRRLLGWAIGGIIAFISSAAGIPVLGAVASAAQRRQEPLTIRLGKLVDYPVGTPRSAQFTVARIDGWVRTLDVRSVWVLRTGDAEVTVYNGRCTHLGCAYSWRADGPQARHFVCPCHDGVFGPDGAVASGPPPRRLDTLPARVEGGVLVVTYQDYQLGVPGKLPA